MLLKTLHSNISYFGLSATVRGMDTQIREFFFLRFMIIQSCPPIRYLMFTQIQIYVKSAIDLIHPASFFTCSQDLYIIFSSLGVLCAITPTTQLQPCFQRIGHWFTISRPGDLNSFYLSLKCDLVFLGHGCG